MRTPQPRTSTQRRNPGQSRTTRHSGFRHLGFGFGALGMNGGFAAELRNLGFEGGTGTRLGERRPQTRLQE